MAGRIAYYGNIVKDGLVLNLDAAKQDSYPGSGTTWNDISGTGNTSLLYKLSSSIDTGAERSINFTTGSMYLECPSTTKASNDNFAWTTSGSIGLRNITIEIWYKTNQISFPNSYLLAKPWNSSGQYNYAVQFLTTSSIRLRVQIESGATIVDFTGVPVADNTWKQLIYWISPTQLGYYLNGTQYSSSLTHTRSGSIPSSGNNQIPIAIMTLYPYGIPGANPAFSITGSLSTVRIYNRVLSAQEVLQNYNATKGRYGL